MSDVIAGPIRPSRLFLAELADRSDATPTPHIILLGDKLYGYGPTRKSAWQSFVRQIQGADWNVQRKMLARAVMRRIDDDHASEVAEMLAAEAIRWEGQS